MEPVPSIYTLFQPEPDFDRLFLPGLSIDPVVFGFHEDRLKVLVLQYHNTDLFALPGGYILKQEDVNDAALRILRERTGLSDIYLEQFYTFGNRARHDRASLEVIMKARGARLTENHFLLQRFVSVGYYALVDHTRAVPADGLADRCAWHDFDQLPPLILDHRTMVDRALAHLQAHLDSKLIGFNLLPATFTMNELQRLYETLLGRPLLRTSFQRKMLHLGILERVAKKWTGGAHKAPYLYRFKPVKGA